MESVAMFKQLAAGFACLLGFLANGQAAQVVTYAGGNENKAFVTACQLSDGSILLGGWAESLTWIPADVPRTPLSAEGIKGSPENGRIGFILQVSGDGQKLLRLIHLPPGAVDTIRHIRVSSLPGASTGEVFFSATLKDDPKGSGGYLLTKLDGNFIKAPPQKLLWVRNVFAAGDTREIQPWDVGGDGKVVYASGQSYSREWMAVYRLKSDGMDDTVEDWRCHWGVDAKGKETEAQFTPLSSRPDFKATRSGLAMKLWGRGCLRSWTQEDYDAWLPDGNGRLKKGRWPDDYYFKGPFDPAKPTNDGPGYTGYSINSPCPRVGAILVDRRNNDFYVGYSVQTRLPDGNPDFEPALVAMTRTGKLKWWSRLYHEFLSKQKDGTYQAGDARNSTPDQYVDHLAMDVAGNNVVVGARCHGNNVVNLWAGNEVAARPGARGFQDHFSGKNGNIHISWLGKLSVDDGHLFAATYVAEYVDGMDGAGAPSREPLLEGWPSYNAGWPNVNTTRLHDLQVDDNGRVYIIATGRRVVTTANAYMKMPKKGEGVSQWCNFVRVYTPDMNTLVYSSILSGKWDPTTGAEGGKVELRSVVPVPNGALVVGANALDEKPKQPTGTPLLTTKVPTWGTEKPIGITGIFSRLEW
ncbi:MAG TPA: hypothetical protein VGP72_20500 [Planctomycetota bacterium]|jgi:hypothetical protein